MIKRIYAYDALFHVLYHLIPRAHTLGFIPSNELSSVLLEFIESNDLDSTEAPKPRERSESAASTSSPPLLPDSYVSQSEEDEEDALSAAIAMSLSDVPTPPKQTQVKPSTAKPIASPSKKPPVNQRADGLDNIAEKLSKAKLDDDLMADSYIAPSALEVLFDLNSRKFQFHLIMYVYCFVLLHTIHWYVICRF